MNLYFITITRQATGQKIQTHTYAADHMSARCRVATQMDEQGSWFGWAITTVTTGS